MLTVSLVVAELWQLLQRGRQEGEVSVELRMNRGQNDKTDGKLATIVVRVAVQTDTQQS